MAKPLSTSPITADDHSPLILIAVYFLMVTFILSVFIRFAIRLGIARSVSTDDWISLSSMFVGIAQSVAVTIAAHHGLGKAENLLSASQVITVLKAQYAADYFCALAIGLSKISVLLLLRRLTVDRWHKRITLYTTYFVIVWTATTILTLALRCVPHVPWSVLPSSPQSCMDVKAFWIAISIFDILTEGVIMTIPILMMIPVHVSIDKKLVIIFAFLFRLLVVIPTIIRLVYIIPVLPATNFTFRAETEAILTQTVLCAAITTACIPCLKPFLDAFASGQMGVHFKNGVPATGSISNSRGYPMRDLDYGNNLAYGGKSAVKNHVNASAVDDEDEDEIVASKYGSHRSLQNTNGQPSGARERSEDSNSVASEAKSDQMIIKKNIAWTVSYEDREGAMRENHDITPNTPGHRKGRGSIGYTA